jgi:CDP-paratose 2-epimerase
MTPVAPSANARIRRALITGGAGFIATNLAQRLLDDGHQVVLFDNLSRPGVERNVAWLAERYPRNLTIHVGDIRNADQLRRAMSDVHEIYHFAAQVAVTTSLTHPIHDFDVNARGTLNLLELARTQPQRPSLVFTSTNKVYGALRDVKLAIRDGRYEPEDDEVRANGIGETRAVTFHSPYGCSKGAADQYVLDYAETFGLPTVVFRMSCIYGPHQCGTEDQGWVAHFVAEALAGRTLTIYGDGRQVRDVLFVSDLVNALITAQANAAALAGHAFNIGGGPSRTISLLELLEIIRRVTRRAVACRFSAWRAADQRFYVSDTRRFEAATGWRPVVSVEDGIRRLLAWLTHNLARQRAAEVAAS